MKKVLLFLLFSIGFMIVKAQQIESTMVLRDDLDSCDIVRPDVLPKDFHWDIVQLYYIYHYTATFDYPEEAKKNHIRGNVLCTFRITKDCKLTDYKVYKGLGYGLDELALDHLNLLTDPSAAAEYQGEKVDLLCMVSIIFNYEPSWPFSFAKDFSMEKLLEEKAIIIGDPQEDVQRRCVKDVSEIDFECRVPYVRFKVKSRYGRITKVNLEKSSGFKVLDDEAIQALWNLEYWEGGCMKKDTEYIIPVRFDANLQQLEDAENQD